MLHYNFRGTDYKVEVVECLPEGAVFLDITPFGDIWLGGKGVAYLIA